MPRNEKRSGPCELCGVVRVSLHRDHIIPKWKGGGEGKENIQWLCANCHEDKTRTDLKGIPGPNKGRVFSAESRYKMSVSASERQREKGHTKGLVFSEERRRQHSEAMKASHARKPRKLGPQSEESRRKKSESLKRFHAERREAQNDGQ